LGQGPNQALQDALCLAKLISKVNREIPLETSFVEFPSVSNVNGWLFFPLFSFFSVLKLVFDGLTLRAYKRGSLEAVAYEFEKKRKFHVAMLTLLSRFLGVILTSTNVHFKIAFFRMLSVSGLASLLFFKPMKPVM
jgi:hypothetical protein